MIRDARKDPIDMIAFLTEGFLKLVTVYIEEGEKQEEFNVIMAKELESIRV